MKTIDTILETAIPHEMYLLQAVTMLDTDAHKDIDMADVYSCLSEQYTKKFNRDFDADIAHMREYVHNTDTQGQTFLPLRYR